MSSLRGFHYLALLLLSSSLATASLEVADEHCDSEPLAEQGASLLQAQSVLGTTDQDLDERKADQPAAAGPEGVEKVDRFGDATDRRSTVRYKVKDRLFYDERGRHVDAFGGKLFGAMRVEMSIKSRLANLHKSKQGPLPTFLETLRSELAQSARMPESRINMLGVRGEYGTLNRVLLMDTSALEKVLSQAGVGDEARVSLEGRDGSIESARVRVTHDKQGKPHEEVVSRSNALVTERSKQQQPEETAEAGAAAGAAGAAGTNDFTIVDFEVKPALTYSGPAATTAFTSWKQAIGDETSSLMTGPLKDILAGSQLRGREIATTNDYFWESGATRQGAAVLASLVVCLAALVRF